MTYSCRLYLKSHPGTEYYNSQQLTYSSIYRDIHTQTITDLRTESTGSSSIMVKWSLSESNLYDSEGTFSVYFGFGNFDILAGTTKDLFFEISGLVQNVNYTLRVELLYPYSTHIISATNKSTEQIYCLYYRVSYQH